MNQESVFADLVDRSRALSDSELRTLLELLGEQLKARYKTARIEAAAGLRVGDHVAITREGRVPMGAVGHIIAIRRGLVTVHFHEHGCWRVDATSVRKVAHESHGCGASVE